MVLTDLKLLGRTKKKQFLRYSLEKKNCTLRKHNENGKLMDNWFYVRYLRVM